METANLQIEKKVNCIQIKNENIVLTGCDVYLIYGKMQIDYSKGRLQCIYLKK